MAFPRTLQKYIFREMGKAFLLAALALTGVMSFGGGVLQMIKLGEVTPSQLIRLLALILPLSLSLTLPVAALFSAAATYGRLSADNEFVACRASGINLHVLFLPTLVLSLFSAGVSFGFTNYLIPDMVRHLNEFVGADVGAIIQQRLNRPRGITLGQKYRIHADRCLTGPDRPNEVTLERVAFVELAGAEWVRFGTARRIDLRFNRVDQRTRVDGMMLGLSYYDRRQGQFFEEAHQTLPGNELPSLVPMKIKYLKLHELFYYLSNPDQWHEVREATERLRRKVGSWTVYDDLARRWREGDKRFTLDMSKRRFEFSSPGAARGGLNGEFVLQQPRIEERHEGQLRVITAETATFELISTGDIHEAALQVDLRHVRFTDGVATYERSKELLGPMAIDSALLDRIASWDERELITRASHLPGDPFARERRRVLETKGGAVRRITGALSERAAFSSSVFVLVILAAALGIIYRGSHVMTAFGISFIPALFVLLTIVMGRQMSQNAGTHGLGLCLMWTGIVTVAGVDVWTLQKVLRR